MSSVWMAKVWQSELQGTMRWVALAIADTADKDGEADLKVKNVCEMCKLSETAVKFAMRSLEQARWLRIDRDKAQRIAKMQMMDGSGNDGSGNDGSGNDGSGNDGSGNDGSGNDGSAEVVTIGKSLVGGDLLLSEKPEETEKEGQTRKETEPDHSPHTPLSRTYVQGEVKKELGESAERGARRNLRDSPTLRPTLDQVKEYGSAIGLPSTDGEYLFENWGTNGWMRGKTPIRDWKACCRAWKAAGYLPSQQEKKRATRGGYRPIDYSNGF